MNKDIHKQRVNEILSGKGAGFNVESRQDAQLVINEIRGKLLDRKPIDWGKEIHVREEKRVRKDQREDLVECEYEIPKVAEIKFKIGEVKDLYFPGAITLEDNLRICKIDRLAVHVDSLKKGLGVGKEMLRKVIEKAKEEGCDRVMLNAEELEDSDYETKEDHPYFFYSALGFETDFDAEVGDTNVEVERILSENKTIDEEGRTIVGSIPMVMYLNKQHK
jgi:GNAT superfamily N-acetyltransferase